MLARFLIALRRHLVPGPRPSRILPPVLGLLLLAGAGTRADFILDETEDMVPDEPEAVQVPFEAHEVLPIGVIQGPVTDQDDGLKHRSPFEDREVMVEGVVHARLLINLGEGRRGYGFYLQNTLDAADVDPDTSDAIFVWTGGGQRIATETDGFEPMEGDELVLKGTVREVKGLTQLVGAELVRVIRRETRPEELLATFEADPPDTPATADRYWERREGMRCTLPAGALLTSGRKIFDRTADAEVWAIHPARPVARRDDPYHSRVFRDAHPLDDIPERLVDNQNGYRIRLGSLGLKRAGDDPDAMLPPLRVFDRITRDETGVVHQTYDRYSVELGEAPRVERWIHPYANRRTTRPPAATHFTVGTFNVENLYDLRDDPYDDFDAHDDPGGPEVRKPFNYVPRDLATYRARLHVLAVQIVRAMQAPDIVMIQEAEDQDIAAVEGVGLRVPGRDNVDGRPDTLQELALAIRFAGGPAYEVAADRDGADVRGITCAFLFNPRRVRLVRPEAAHPVLGRMRSWPYRGMPLPGNAEIQNPKAINAVLPSDVDTSTGLSGTNVFSRALQVALFEVFPGPGREDAYHPVYVLNNHFSSRPDQRVGQRREQAALNAAVAGAILDEHPAAYLVMGGDLNVYPRPDDPFPDPSDQLAPLYEAGLWNLYTYLLEQDAGSAYTYVYQGQAQTLDQLFLSPALRRHLAAAWVPHVNSDWPAGVLTDGRFGASDHEPVVAAFRF